MSNQTNEEFADWQMIPWLVGLGHRLEREDGHEPREIQQIINLLRQIYSDNLRMRELIDNLRGIGESPTHARRVGRPYTKDCIDSLKISIRLLAKQMDRALDTQELSDNE